MHQTFKLQDALLRFEQQFPTEFQTVAAFQNFLSSHPDVYQRFHPPGHFTASCWLVSADGMRVLLTHHKKLQRWLQLGGHADGDMNLIQVALREAEEESGLTNLEIESTIFDLDAHEIPARGADPGHVHWDVRFVIWTRGSEAFSISEESLDLAWRDIAQVAADDHADASLRRMAQKWLSREANPPAKNADP
jgi:8-oxo-dGTP pyrophosphatase MutT (NUDIX family)